MDKILHLLRLNKSVNNGRSMLTGLLDFLNHQQIHIAFLQAQKALEEV